MPASSSRSVRLIAPTKTVHSGISIARHPYTFHVIFNI